METFSYIVLVPMVYLAAAVFVIGTIIRLVKISKAPKHPSTLKIYGLHRKRGWFGTLLDTFLLPTIRRQKPVFWCVLIIFHVSLLLLIVGHVDLLGEISFLQSLDHDRLLGGGWVSILVTGALLFFLFRRFRSPVRELSIPEDYYLLILLLLIVIFGAQMGIARNWYDYDTLMIGEYREYLGGLLHFNMAYPESLSEGGHSFMLVMHVFCANLFLIFFPFSQSMHSFLSLPLNKLRRG